MRAREFIFEDYKDAKKEFSRVADPAVVQTTIDQYKQLVNRNQFRNPIEKNIDHWRGRGWEAFSQMVKLKSSDTTNTQLKKGKVVGEMITLQDDDEWIVLIPLDKETSVHYGRGAEWCTTKPHMTNFEEYVYEHNITLIYAIDKTKAGRSVAISITPYSTDEKIEMFDQQDKSINAEKYKEISGLDSAKFIQMAKLPENQQQLTASIKKYKVSRANTAKLLKASPLDPEAIERELKFTKNQFDCYNYIRNYSKEQNSRVKVHPSVVAAVSTHFTSHKRDTRDNAGQYIDFSNIPVGVLRSILRTTLEFIIYNADALSPNQKIVITEYETSIKDDPQKSFGYCRITNKRFPAGELVISKDAAYAFAYATLLFENDGWPAGEASIATSPKYSYEYAEAFAGKLPDDRLAAVEAGIATDSEYSYKYAYYVLKKPFPAGEPAILDNGMTCNDYTNYILAYHRSPSWEQLIKDDPKNSYEYAIARKEPFPAGEPAILTNKWYSRPYTNNILSSHRSPTWEQLIKHDPAKSIEYATARNKPFPAGEPAIASDSPTSIQYIMRFAAESPTWENVIKDNPDVAYFHAVLFKKRFPEGEAAIATNVEFAADYNSRFGTNLSQQ